MFQPVENELFFFGACVDKFLPHKAGRVVGMFEARDQNGRVSNCFRLQYPDGEIAHAAFVDGECHDFEFLTWIEAVTKHGEEAFR